MLRCFLGVVILLVLSSCARAPLEKSEDALRLSETEPNLRESLPIAPLVDAIRREMEHLLQTRRNNSLQFGDRTIRMEDYVRSLGHFLELIYEHKDYQALWQAIRKDFDVYETYGRENWGEAFITSYYEPLIEGSRRPKGRFTQALYRMPDDLVEVKLRMFGDEYATSPSAVRGRLVQNEEGEFEVVPYFSRKEIDEERGLQGKQLELFYVDPIESFFLQIQGSGTVKLDNGREVRVGYAGQNGHAYKAIGRFLTHAIPLEEMSLQRIEAFLRDLSPRELQRYLNMNPSYIFFKPLKENAVTYLGVPATAGRTIAVDRKFNPLGALGILEFQTPVFSDAESSEPVAWKDTANFVLAQDVGGAIKGSGRVDLFWGRGKFAKRAAGVMKQTGKLYFLAPNEELLEKLRERGNNYGIRRL